MIALGTAALQSTEPSRGVSIGLWVAFGLAVLWLVVSIAEHWRHRRHVALAEKGEALAKRLTTFAGARRRAEPPHRFSSATTEEERQRDWERQNEENDRHRTETQAQYHHEHVGDIAEFLDEAKDAGFEVDPELERHLGFLAGPSPIEDTAHQVRVLASRIRRGRRPKWRQRRKG